MAKSPENELSDLHGNIARVMTEQVLKKEAVCTFDDDGNQVPTDEEEYTATPALLAVAAKFLKDNHITADIKTDTNMGNLKAALNKKNKHSQTQARRLATPSAAALSLVEE